MGRIPRLPRGHRIELVGLALPEVTLEREGKKNA